MKRKITFFLAFVLSLAFIAGCGNGNDSTDGDAADVQEGGEVVWVSMSDAPSLDPHGQNDSATTDATSQIFERLVDYADDGSVVPLLADSFEAIDEYTWEFQLREGVTFHDGTEFNAEAVKISFERLLDPENASPRLSIFEMISEVVVVDELTVQFVTEFPFSPLPSHLAHNGGSIIAPSAIQEEEEGGRTVGENPIGTGPFKLESWDRGSEIRFARNDDYWGDPVHIDTLVFRVVPEVATRVSMLETGEAHGTAVDALSAGTVEAMDGVTLTRQEGTGVTYIGFNTQKAPFDDVRVRQAITMAINKEDIVNELIEGEGILAAGPLSPLVVGSTQDVDTLDFDVEAARALLEEAGHADGFEATIWINEGNAARASIAELVQANLSEIGITLSIESIEWGAYLERTGAGEHEMFILGWTTITADADYGLFPILHSSQVGDPGNRFFFENDQLDELLELGRRTADQEERNDIYAEAIQLVIDEAPMVNLFFPNWLTGTNGIEGLHVDFNGTPFFHGVYLTE